METLARCKVSGGLHFWLGYSSSNDAIVVLVIVFAVLDIRRKFKSARAVVTIGVVGKRKEVKVIRYSLLLHDFHIVLLWLELHVFLGSDSS